MAAPGLQPGDEVIVPNFTFVAPGLASADLRRAGHPSLPSKPIPGIYFGWGTIRRYGLGDFQPPGYFCFASSSCTAGGMINSSPAFQFTGRATFCLGVNCIESRTRSSSSKLRPVLIG